MRAAEPLIPLVNISACLILKARVYLNEKSGLFQPFIRKGGTMSDSDQSYEADCREYCEPLHTACLNAEDDDKHCEERLEQCLSFCEFA
jgi:hypothetical protein